MDSKVLNVERVELKINKINPPELEIAAWGLVTTTGWSNGRLKPWVYITPPADGIWDFDFVATPPAGNVLHVISQIEGYVEVPIPHWLTGVRVHASAGKPVEAMLADLGEDNPYKTYGENDLPWPWVVTKPEKSSSGKIC